MLATTCVNWIFEMATCCQASLHMFLPCKVFPSISYTTDGIAQSVKRLAAGWTVRGSNPGGGELFRTYPDRPCGLPSLLYSEDRVFFPGVKRPGRGVDYPHQLAPRLKKEQSYTSIPPLGLRGLL